MNNEQQNTINTSGDISVLMTVAFNESKNSYIVNLAKGSNVAETAFAMSVVIKCLMKDGIIKSTNEVTELIDKYLNDPQYNELEEAKE